MQNRQDEKVGKGATPAPESKRSGAGGKGQENREDHFSIQIPQISLPKGGGAIKGIDEKFEINAANGTASLSLPLPFSPGRNGFMPAISLGYNSGAGNGLFGLGWDLGYPSIQRKTDKKLPRYKDDEDSDTFMFSGVEDLVPFLKPEGGPLPQNIRWTRDERVEEGFTIRRYRPRLEGAFSRIERISHLNYGVWWKVTTRENVVTFYGKTPEFRIADPEDPSRIFQWLPELSFDDKGNCVLYEFKPEDGAGYGEDLFDANRFHPGNSPRFTNRYLKRVYYCPRTPFLPYRTFREQNRQIPAGAIYYTTNPVAEKGFLMELVLDYGEHGDLPDTGQGTVSVRYTLDSNAPAWGARHDAFSSYRSGFDVRTARLCRRVLMFHHFAELGNTPCLVRSLDLQYRDWSMQQEPEEGKKMEVTYLEAAVQRSYIREANNPTRYRYRGLPPVEFGYEELIWDRNVRTISPENTVHAPAGLTTGYQWVDLYNEGISGILTEQGEGWFYKENLGNGQFTPAKPVIPKPSFTGIASGVLQLQDLEADGRKQVVVNSPGLNGYFELTEDNGWETFRAFGQIPNVDLRDPNTRLLDLNGDGQPDIVITEENVFTWYPSAGVNGYDAPELAHKPFDEEQGPAVVFADAAQSIYLADMSGDGLTDIVRIRNGETCYWPNLGYGRFGAKITMSRSPWFDTDDQFNPAYLQLADVSGTGATDILYLGKNRFCAWLNLSGNAWSEPCEIEPFFDTAQPNQISVTDLLGNGTACIVWSSPLPGNAVEPLRYIDLMGGKKPHILTTYRNNLGKITTWSYKSSTHYYLEDKKAGAPWITRLPFPVQVVDRVTVEDTWRNTRFSNRYSYHHGYYDHPEREFRGFGRVEQTDIEDFGKFEAGNAGSPYITTDKTLYQPPVKTITWHHTGAFLSRDRILNQFEQEYFRPNGGDFRENELPEPDLVTQNLSADEYREALRACKGMTLRTEAYELAVDDAGHVTDRRVRYFSAAFHNCHIRRLQARGGNLHSVFLVTESEAITYHYELPLQNGLPQGEADPRIAHTLNLSLDDLGNVRQAAAIGYPRRPETLIDDPLLPVGAADLIRQVQRQLHIAYTENRFTNDVIDRTDYRLRLPCEVLTFELTGISPRSDGLARHYFTLDELRQYRLSELYQEGETTVETIGYQVLPDRSSRQKRLVEHVRMLFFNETLNGHLPLGTLNRLGLPYQTYKIALTESLLTAVLGDKLPALRQPGETHPAMLNRVLAQGGYHAWDGAWWIRSGIAGFAEDAALHYYLPEKYTDPFGNETLLTFDTPYDLYIQSSRDPVGNRMEVVRFDYRVLAPLEMRDPNDNLSEVVFDLLGQPAAAALKGKGGEGDNLTGVPVELSPEAVIEFFTGDYHENTARSLLGNATIRHIYYLGERRGANGDITYGHHPACSAGLMRERHLNQPGGNASPLQAGFEYSDGGGAVIVTKTLAEPDGAGPLRWIANGKTVLNNKGKPVKQYEPYFSATGHRFEEPLEVGVTPIIYYDAAGRTVRTEMPDGTYSRVEFTPWFFRAFDANDTVLETGNGWYETNQNSEDEARRRAAQLAAVHCNTPACTHTDSLGREVIAIAHNRWRRRENNAYVDAEEKYLTWTQLDTEGKPLWLRDARNNYVMVYARVNNPEDFRRMYEIDNYVPAYDIAGNLLFQHSNEAGDRWMLPDSTGHALYTWDMNERNGVLENYLYTTDYDALRRVIRQWLQVNGGPRQLVGSILYGDNPTLTNPAARNLRGQPVEVRGPEGRNETVRFDFKGNLLEARRRLVQDAAFSIVDWQTSPTLMPEVFVQNTEYDALNRMIRLENWHIEGRAPAVYTPNYNRRGVLQSETLSIGGQPAAEAIRRIEYNAKGQRTRLQYGNNTSTRYDYDPLTFRLTRLFTVRVSIPRGQGGDNATLQDLRYTYDPAGNITEIRDDAYEPVFFRNQQVEPRSQYEYDALYRLISASGRENDHAAGPPKGYGAVEEMPPVTFGTDQRALRNYTQYYTYDPAGNFVEMRHAANGGSWTRHYETDPQSNRLQRTWLGSDQTNAVVYSYDTHGSLLNFLKTPDALRNRWDYRDMIHTLSLEGGGTAHYQYDSGKQRTRKVIRRQNNEYWERIYLEGFELYRRYLNNQLAEETETHHLFADDQRILLVENVRQSVHRPPSTVYHFQYGNHLGSCSLECDDQARILSYEEYHPYGTTAYQARNAAIASAIKRYRYTGMERDEESGLAYHTARYYLTWLGRWGSCDPIGVRGASNLYEYSNTSPILILDHSGRQGNRPRLLDGERLRLEPIHSTESLLPYGNSFSGIRLDFLNQVDPFSFRNLLLNDSLNTFLAHEGPILPRIGNALENTLGDRTWYTSRSTEHAIAMSALSSFQDEQERRLDAFRLLHRTEIEEEIADDSSVEESQPENDHGIGNLTSAFGEIAENFFGELRLQFRSADDISRLINETGGPGLHIGILIAGGFSVGALIGSGHIEAEQVANLSSDLGEELLANSLRLRISDNLQFSISPRVEFRTNSSGNLEVEQFSLGMAGRFSFNNWTLSVGSSIQIPGEGSPSGSLDVNLLFGDENREHFNLSLRGSPTSINVELAIRF